MGGGTVSVMPSNIDDDDKEFENDVNEKRNSSVYAQVINNYDDFTQRLENMESAKSKILSYKPGSWVGNGMTPRDYNVPETTTLLLIGPKGSGKSSLVNRISRVFEDDKFAPERAQVTYSSCILDGTRFLQEYMVPRYSTSFCLYDAPGFSDDLFESLEMVKRWMTKGVRHGELVNRFSSSFQAGTKGKTREDKLVTYERRRVDFVIFVVNGLSVLKCMKNSGAESQYVHKVTKVFESPFLSFKDHKPVIAITHGDLLSIDERACVRVYLGDLLGVHPSKQAFDIPDNYDPRTELTIVDLMRYALEHADRNLPCKPRPTISKGSTILLWTQWLLLLAVGIFMFTILHHGFHSLKLNKESVSRRSMEMKKVIEIVPVPTLELENVMELNKKVTHLIEKIREFDQES